MNLFTFVTVSKLAPTNRFFLKKWGLIVLSIFWWNISYTQSPCDTDAHRQFDFWVGEWDVFSTKADTLVGHNTIHKILNNCVLLENWTGGSGFTGKSFNTYNPVDSTWNQVWVDVSGATYHFKGRLEDNAMQLNGETIGRSGKKILFELSFHPDKTTGHVRQVWKQSNDNGKNWIVIFDGTYKKKE